MLGLLLLWAVFAVLVYRLSLMLWPDEFDSVPDDESAIAPRHQTINR